MHVPVCAATARIERGAKTQNITINKKSGKRGQKKNHRTMVLEDVHDTIYTGGGAARQRQ
jgi:hypothetical protein